MAVLGMSAMNGAQVRGNNVDRDNVTQRSEGNLHALLNFEIIGGTLDADLIK